MANTVQMVTCLVMTLNKGTLRLGRINLKITYICGDQTLLVSIMSGSCDLVVLIPMATTLYWFE